MLKAQHVSHILRVHSVSGKRYGAKVGCQLSFSGACQRRSYSRPPNAPRPTLDIAHIRRNPGLYEQNCQERNYPQLARHAWKIAELWDEQAKLRAEAHPLREKSNDYNDQLKRLATSAKSGKQEDNSTRTKASILYEARRVKEQLSGLVAREKALEDEMESLAIEIPNLSDATHTGTEIEVIDVFGDSNATPSPGQQSDAGGVRSDPHSIPLHHLDIGNYLGILDLSSAATTSGWGWYYLVGAGALLEQALVQHALSVCLSNGWSMVSPPTMVYDHIAGACGFQPRDQNDETQIYGISNDPRVLAGTAEIPLAALKANTVLEPSQLPLKLVGVSRCYRAEAGARGSDTRGLYRVHEFTKVEMFGWTLPDALETSSAEPGNFETAKHEQRSHSTDLFDEVVRLQRAILEPLGLHCRVLAMPSTDLGASASRKIDIEAYFPSRAAAGKDEGWGELTSVSNCTDYQSRRLNTRVKRVGVGKTEFVHTVNGTALAVPRVIAALLENGWDTSTRTVHLPDCLKQWMHGHDEIRKQI